MHSSLAAILTVLALANLGLMSPMGGLGFVLGSNMGSALLPIWLLRNESAASKTVAQSVAFLRAGLAILMIVGMAVAPQHISIPFFQSTTDMMLAAHLGFNALLLLLVPFANGIIARLHGKTVTPLDTYSAFAADHADPDVILSSLKSQASQMLERLSQMLASVTRSTTEFSNVAEQEVELNKCLAELRRSYAKLPTGVSLPDDEVQATIAYAIRLKACGDIISGKFACLCRDFLKGDFSFTETGAAEINALVDQVQTALHLAKILIWKDDTNIARRLVQHKQDVSQLESRSRQNHLDRVRGGNLTSLSSSDQHLEMIAALKSVNSKLAAIGYSVLDARGGLRKTRLKSKA